MRGGPVSGTWRGWSHALVLFASLCAGAGRADSLLPPVVPRHGAVEIVAADGWFGPSSAATLEDARTGRMAFAPMDLRNAIPFRSGQALWLRLRVQAPATSAGASRVDLPVPVLDAATLHQQDAGGRWTAQRAGDQVRLRDWDHPGRYPSFVVAVRPGTASELLLEIRHSTRLTVPLRIVSDAAHEQRAQLEYLGLGLAFGALGLLVAAAVGAGVVLRDGAYACYGAFALLAMLALASFTGVASHVLWGDLPTWPDVAPGVFTLLAGTFALGLARRISPALTRTPWLASALGLGAWAGVFLAAAYPFLDRRDGMIVLGLYVAWVTALCVHVSVGTWRRGERAGLWMSLGTMPLLLALPVALGRGFGSLQGGWFADYALVCAVALELPMLLVALGMRSEERWGAELRRLAGSHQDALTGALSNEVFCAKLRQAVHRRRHRGESTAVVAVELANHDLILQQRGAEAAEDALLRTLVKLRRLVRNVDVTGRLGENRFGVLLEGVSLRQPVGAIATRLVAAGLMEEPRRPKEPLLQLHVVATLTSEHTGTADEILQSLDAMLAEMSPRTRRAFRFFEPAQAGAVDAGEEGEEGEVTLPSAGGGDGEKSSSGLVEG
jgi:GGDEF domain-containing protein